MCIISMARIICASVQIITANLVSICIFYIISLQKDHLLEISRIFAKTNFQPLTVLKGAVGVGGQRGAKGQNLRVFLVCKPLNCEGQPLPRGQFGAIAGYVTMMHVLYDHKSQFFTIFVSVIDTNMYTIIFVLGP